MFAESRFFSTLPDHCRFDRRLLGATYLSENIVTTGAASANTEPVLPSAHRSGIRLGFDEYVVQFGIGVAGPTHVICCRPLGNPVLSSAEPIALTPGVFWKR